ncbi:MAG: hypothetical protein ACLUGP_12440 [Faecalibacterium prausnitzii]
MPGCAAPRTSSRKPTTGDFSQYTFWQYVPDDKDAPDRFLKCEGYLFPDTYDFLKDDTVHHYVETFYAHFDKQITDEMYAETGKAGYDPAPSWSLWRPSCRRRRATSQDSIMWRRCSATVWPRVRPTRTLQSNTSSYVQSDADNNYLWNWVAPYYGGWDNIPENIRGCV